MRAKASLKVIAITILLLALAQTAFAQTSRSPSARGGPAAGKELPYPVTSFKVNRLTQSEFAFSLTVAEPMKLRVTYGSTADKNRVATLEFRAARAFAVDVPLGQGDQFVGILLANENQEFSTVMFLNDTKQGRTLQNEPSVDSEISVTSSMQALATNLESEPNDTTSLANPAQSGDDNYGYISSTSDVDYWKFTLSGHSYVNVFLGSIPVGTDYDLYVYNSSGTLVASSANGGNADELILGKRLDPGTYYVKVFSFSGSSTSDSYLMRWRLVKAWPVIGSTRITQTFSAGTHLGIDIGAKTPNVEGDPIVSYYDGTVSLAGWVEPGYGWVVYINHNVDGRLVQSRYAHLRDAPTLTAGTSVNAGRQIGVMGNTGTSTGAHLHFETRHCVASGCTNANADSNPVDPIANYFSDMPLTYDTSASTLQAELYPHNPVIFTVDEVLKMTPAERAKHGIPESSLPAYNR